MKLKLKHRIDTQFSMSSMTDIIFLLLLFFMLTVSFVPPIGVSIDLPSSEQTQMLSPQIKVTITANQAYYVDGIPIDASQLYEVLTGKVTNPNYLILLEVDKTVPIQPIIRVIDIATNLQARVSIATQLN